MTPASAIPSGLSTGTWASVGSDGGAERNSRPGELARRWRARLDLTTVVALSALTLSALSFYRSYTYTKQQLDVTVTEVSYVTNQAELYITVAFANGGNRDPALLRAEPALWTGDNRPKPAWVAVAHQIGPDIPLASPKPPLIIKAGGVEVATLSTRLDAAAAEHARVSSHDGAFLGVRAATMNSDGNLYLMLESPVAKLDLDGKGRIKSAEAAIHRTLSGFTDLQGAPPGDFLQENKKTHSSGRTSTIGNRGQGTGTRARGQGRDKGQEPRTRDAPRHRACV
jgi:hypothetical protein